MWFAPVLMSCTGVAVKGWLKGVQVHGIGQQSRSWRHRVQCVPRMDPPWRKGSHLLADWWGLHQGSGFPPEVETWPTFIVGPAFFLIVNVKYLGFFL